MTRFILIACLCLFSSVAYAESKKLNLTIEDHGSYEIIVERDSNGKTMAWCIGTIYAGGIRKEVSSACVNRVVVIRRR